MVVGVSLTFLWPILKSGLPHMPAAPPAKYVDLCWYGDVLIAGLATSLSTMSSLRDQGAGRVSRNEDDDDDSIVLFAQEEGRTVNKTHSYDSEKTGELTGSDVDEHQSNDEMSALLRAAAHFGSGYNTTQDVGDKKSTHVGTQPNSVLGSPRPKLQSLAARSKWKRIASSVDGMLVENDSSSSLEQHREAVLNLSLIHI